VMLLSYFIIWRGNIFVVFNASYRESVAVIQSMILHLPVLSVHGINASIFNQRYRGPCSLHGLCIIR
jgi:hypothetical protein